MAHPPISLFIITLNEADRIAATLEAAQGLASDIIVVDSGSTDGTQDIAARYGARVIHRDFDGYGTQKRFAEDVCTHDWVLNLDADEVMSMELVAEIKALDFASDGYILNIADVLPAESKPGHFAHTTKAVRLYRKSKGRYAESPVHDRVHFSSGAVISPTHARIWHYSVRSLAHAIEKANRYSTMQAADIIARGKVMRFLKLRLLCEPFIAFIKSYILRLDMLRGYAGFINSMAYAWFRFMRLAKVYEQRRKG